MVKLSIEIPSDFYDSRQEDGSKQEIMSPESFSWTESEHLKFELEHLFPTKQNKNPSSAINKTNK